VTARPHSSLCRVLRVVALHTTRTTDRSAVGISKQQNKQSKQNCRKHPFISAQYQFDAIRCNAEPRIVGIHLTKRFAMFLFLVPHTVAIVNASKVAHCGLRRN